MPVITTYLEMCSRDEFRPKPTDDSRFWIRELVIKQWQYNRFMYGLVGAPWAWKDKEKWSDQQWRDYGEADNLRTFGAYVGGSPAGYYELRREGGDVQIVYFGLAPQFVGQGFGAALLTCAIEDAWSWGASRVWVHTCTLDHPAALRNYQARGMRIYKTEIRE